ncbi:MAG: NYN domain-containing protein [Pirellulaceae bacterium]|nr:NYN domain-containing protein [Pirellulaceae bacterium]
MSIVLLIDGYNLLHATGAVGVSRGPGGLARARDRMLAQIAAGLTESQRLLTQIVFDAKRRDSQNNESIVRGMTVTYAVGFDEADDLLEDIIRHHGKPQALTVVSSDLRVQRCAKARKANVVGCDQWLMQLMDGKPVQSSIAQAQRPTEPKELDPSERTDADLKLSAEEVDKWLREFGL